MYQKSIDLELEFGKNPLNICFQRRCRMYLTEKIGEGLKKWMIKERKGKILYLVNRKIRKKQMEKDLKKLSMK